LVNREKISKEMAVSEFEEVLRGLKTELRNSIYELEYLQTYKKTLECQQEY
jgi:cobalt-zinc-cadmium efflux system outer membrane protein